MASAKKRRGRGSFKNAVKKETARKTAYAKKHYKGRPGGIYIMNSDRRNSRGAYTHGMTGKKYGKKMKRVNKVAQTMVNIQSGGIVLGVSYVRGRRAGTIKKRRR